MRLARLLIIFFLPVAACGRSQKREPSPPATEDSVFPSADVSHVVSDPEELRRAAMARHRDVAGLLGTHQFRGSAALRVTERGQAVESWAEETRLEQDAAGTLHASYVNSKDYGREIFFHADTVWVRPRYGKFHRRPPAEPDEPARLADETWATLGAVFELCGHAAQVSETGTAVVGGRDSRRLALALGGAARTRPPEHLPQRQWRNSIQVKALVGELALDSQTGVVLSGRLACDIAFQRDGRPFEMHAEVTHSVEVGGQIAITLPDDEASVPTPLRSRNFEEREKLLEGLAPPARRAAASSAPKE